MGFAEMYSLRSAIKELPSAVGDLPKSRKRHLTIEYENTSEVNTSEAKPSIPGSSSDSVSDSDPIINKLELQTDEAPSSQVLETSKKETGDDSVKVGAPKRPRKNAQVTDQDDPEEKWEPPLWKEQYENIRTMREGRDAPVDTSGAFTLPDSTAPPKVGIHGFSYNVHLTTVHTNYAYWVIRSAYRPMADGALVCLSSLSQNETANNDIHSFQ